MADIFISWTKKDAAVVTTLVDELEKLGFDLYEYERDSPLGGDIPDSTKSEIDKAHLALICFDDATFDAQWIITEVAWCDSAVKDDKLPMSGIIPVWVGPHPKNQLPELLKGRYPAFDLEQMTHNKVYDLASRIVRNLPNEERYVVYGAVYAMTAAQFQAVRVENPKVGQLAFGDYIDSVCAYLGMPGRPELSLLDLLQNAGQNPDH